MQKTLLMYFRKSTATSKEEQKINRDITFAGVRVGDVMQIAGTKCSPREQFEKKKARIIAEGRATKKPIAQFETTGLNDKQVVAQFVDTCKNLFNNRVLFNG